MRLRSVQPIVVRAASPTRTQTQCLDRSQGVPAIVGITLSFGQPSSFTVLEPTQRRWG